jgi:hypothetical protein
MSLLEMEYNTDPEEILDGEEIDQKHSYCGICFEDIYQPILKGIWYHSHRSEEDHEPIEATFLELLYLRFIKYEDRRGHNEFDVCKSKRCKCGNIWFDYLVKNQKLPSGFSGDHFFLNGYSVCKKNWHLDYQNFEGTELEFPEKQSYLCPKCLEFLRRKKIIKIIEYDGKRKLGAYNKLSWNIEKIKELELMGFRK